MKSLLMMWPVVSAGIMRLGRGSWRVYGLGEAFSASITLRLRGGSKTERRGKDGRIPGLVFCCGLRIRRSIRTATVKSWHRMTPVETLEVANKMAVEVLCDHTWYVERI